MEPWNKIVQFWTNTTKYRIRKLHAESRVINNGKGKTYLKNKSNKLTSKTNIQNKTIENNISSYTTLYPALKQLGYTLVNIHSFFISLHN